MITDILVILGSLCFLIASLGLFRMPDAFSRIHAATKASSLGVILLSFAAIVEFTHTSAILFSLLTVLLVFLTAPLACHTISVKLLDKDSDE